MRKLAMIGVQIAVATNALAQDNAVHSGGRISIEASAGFVEDFNDSNLWEDGYNGSVGAFWWASESVYLGTCLSLLHWSYVPDDIVTILVPDNGTLLATQSTGDAEVIELVPSVRWERSDALPLRLGGFVQAGAGVAYVRTFALTEVIYDIGTEEIARYEVDESEVQMEVVAMAGLTRPLSTSSWLELFPSYRVIFMDDATEVWAVSIGYRVQI